jgi:hypothetical protein
MIEVFKTNVTTREQAKMLVKIIQLHFPGYKANFDLEDCDKVLRIVGDNEQVAVSGVMDLVNNFGYQVELLPE